MRSLNKLSAFQDLVARFIKAERQYHAEVLQHQSPINNSSPDEDFPSPVSHNPNHWNMYANLVRLNQQKRDAEARLQRCVDAAEYLVKLIQRNSPSITSKEQWRQLVYPYEHCQNQCKISFDGLQQPIMAQAFAADLGKQMFDFTGGDFSATYVEVVDHSAGGRVEAVRFYFVK